MYFVKQNILVKGKSFISNAILLVHSYAEEPFTRDLVSIEGKKKIITQHYICNMEKNAIRNSSR